jgi:hypothetical protein
VLAVGFAVLMLAGLAGAVAMVGLTVVRHIRFSRQPERHVFDPETSARVRGAASTDSFHVSTPLAELTADASWIHLRGRPIRFINEVWIQRPEVSQIVYRPGFGKGVQFVTKDGALDQVFFRTSKKRRPYDVA